MKYSPVFLALGSMLVLSGCGLFTSDNYVYLGYKADGVVAKQLVMGRTAAGVASVHIISAEMVVAEVEFENTAEAESLSFETDIPYILHLDLVNQIQPLDTALIPATGSFEKFQYKIAKLEKKYGEIYSQNPELQEQSILIKGYLNGNAADTFTFSSSVTEEQEREFNPPLSLDQGTSANMLLTVSVTGWFADGAGGLVDPRVENSHSTIEGNIKASLRVFEDEDNDGLED
jgi:hypothetical protein